MASTPFRRLFHWGPISVLGIIKLITWAMVHLLGMWWPPHGSIAGSAHAALFLTLAGATLYYFLQSLLEGPGFVPLGWKPENEEAKQYLQFCTVCNGYKAPRSHHCRKCGYCIKKMDHHCPWINCCVGHSNHGYFTMFLISAVLGCSQAAVGRSTTDAGVALLKHIYRVWENSQNAIGVFCDLSKAFDCVCHVTLIRKLRHYGVQSNALNVITSYLNNRIQCVEVNGSKSNSLHVLQVLSICMYHAINRVWYIHNGTGREPMIYLTLTTLLLTLLAIGMAVGVVLAVGALLYLQFRGILRNQTTIEDWIVEKAVGRREEQGLPPFVFPYNVGWSKNVQQVLLGSQYDGINWPVKEGCGIYDLTREQIAQKQDKRVRSRLYTAVESYSGHWVPLFSRPRAAFGAPCTDEPRLPLTPGDVIRATRQRRHWLFGEKLIGDGSGRGPRGWFPRDAAAPARPATRKAHGD